MRVPRCILLISVTAMPKNIFTTYINIFICANAYHITYLLVTSQIAPLRCQHVAVWKQMKMNQSVRKGSAGLVRFARWKKEGWSLVWRDCGSRPSSKLLAIRARYHCHSILAGVDLTQSFCWFSWWRLAQVCFVGLLGQHLACSEGPCGKACGRGNHQLGDGAGFCLFPRHLCSAGLRSSARRRRSTLDR
jgi:hypothetical protein